MKLIDLIYPHLRVLSVVGTAKNAGKTVTINEIIMQSHDRGITLGLISTGRDGESVDILTNTKKPKVLAFRGTIVVTLDTLIEREQTNIEIIMVTDYKTALGRVIIGRLIDDGYVEISGPSSACGIREVANTLLSLGAGLVLIDGSIDRRASAAPYVSDGTIMATGAALGRSLELVIQKTMHIVETYRTIEIEDRYIRDLASEIIDNKKTAIIDMDGTVNYINTKTSLNCGDEIARALDEHARFIVLSGSATVLTINQILLNKKSDIKIIVKDPTRIFIPHREFLMFLRMGMSLRVVNGINLIALTVNPYSPDGYYFDPKSFKDKMRVASGEIPVFDVMQGGL